MDGPHGYRIQQVERIIQGESRRREGEEEEEEKLKRIHHFHMVDLCAYENFAE